MDRIREIFRTNLLEEKILKKREIMLIASNPINILDNPIIIINGCLASFSIIGVIEKRE